MDNLFDGARDTAFDLVTKTMGYKATWTPSIGGSAQTEDILFNDPDHARKLGDIEYLPQNSTMEYRKPFFPGLKESVDASGSENVTINSTNYYVRSVKKTEDGNTFIAVLEEVDS